MDSGAPLDMTVPDLFPGRIETESSAGENLEHLQLTLSKAFFLIWGLDCLRMFDPNAVRSCVYYRLCNPHDFRNITFTSRPEDSTKFHGAGVWAPRSTRRGSMMLLSGTPVKTASAMLTS